MGGGGGGSPVGSVHSGQRTLTSKIRGVGQIHYC